MKVDHFLHPGRAPVLNRYSACLICKAIREHIRRRDNSELVLAQKRASYAIHREDELVRRAVFRAAHRDELRDKSAAYNSSHRDERRHYARSHNWKRQAAARAQSATMRLSTLEE